MGLEPHRNLAALIEKYDGSFTPEGDVYFPPQFSGPAPSGIGFNKGANAKFNPMFGEHDYYSIEGTYSFRYITQSEVVIGDSENLIHETSDLPGRPPRYPGRNWVKTGTQWQHIAGVYEVMETYWLSRPGGWKEPIYGRISSQFGSGTGLITGGLQASGGL